MLAAELWEMAKALERKVLAAEHRETAKVLEKSLEVCLVLVLVQCAEDVHLQVSVPTLE